MKIHPSLFELFC